MADAREGTGRGEAQRLATELRLAEYRTVRHEWLAARNAQQQTLQWTLAALAVLIAGVVNSDVRDKQPFLYVALIAVVVAVATCAQAIWFGEVMRMERASLFLRGFEAAFARPASNAADGLPSLLWERWRGDRKYSSGTPWVAKAGASVVASFALYGLFAAAGVVLLIAAAAEARLPRADRHLAIVMACAAVVAYVSVAAYIGVQALRILGDSHKPADFSGFLADAIAAATSHSGSL